METHPRWGHCGELENSIRLQELRWAKEASQALVGSGFSMTRAMASHQEKKKKLFIKGGSINQRVILIFRLLLRHLQLEMHATLPVQFAWSVQVSVQGAILKKTEVNETREVAWWLSLGTQA